jgi:peptidoglycan/xylan/chitin deacetylase (PgdA/CDA1 family)
MSAVLGTALRALARRRSLSLCYHGLGRSTAAADPHFLMVDPDRFRAQLDALLTAGFRLVTVAELAAALPAGGGPPAPGLAALSFDDGTDDNHSVLLPILREYGAPATIYVTTGHLGQPSPWIDPAAGVRFMDEDELREVAAAGIEIGAHTVTHPDLATLSQAACLAEMRDSKEALEAITGKPVTTFAYPFCSYGPAALAAAAEAGFAAAVTCHRRGGWAPLELQRTMITGKDGAASFALKALGAYEPLFHSRAGRVARELTRGARARVRASREGS